MPIDTEVITSAWTPPHTITGFSGTAEEPNSYIMLNWDVSVVSSAEFVMYRLYRRVVGEELWTVLEDFPTQGTSTYNDKTAGQTIQYQYMITQFQSIVGDVPLESEQSEIVSIALVSDAWFIVPKENAEFLAMELTVTDEEHSSVVQQEVFEPLSSSRKRVIRGNVLGDEGSVTAFVDTMSSTVAKNFMNHIKNNKGPHIFKSPFGDVWYVEFDAPGYKYTTGGHLEISFGWVEVI